MTVMACGAAAWLVGNLLWLGGVPLSQVVYWWMGFLVLTIAGERLELGRMLRLSRLSRGLFLAAAGLILGGLLLIGAAFLPGVRLFSVGLLALAAWLARYDIARRTVRLTGLTRYIAVCLLSGYVWLGIGGALGLAYAAGMGGFLYDASLHAILLGFVFGMIFGHAPIIFPAVLNLPVVYRPVLYLPLIFLQISLILRISGDLGGWQMLRQWGGLLNALTLLLFLALMRLGAKSAPA